MLAKIKSCRGSGLIEMPIAVMLLTALFMFFSGFCYAYYHKTVMAMAVNEGARSFGIDGNLSRAIEVTESELMLGGVREAHVTYNYGNEELVVIKNIGFYIPLAKRCLFRLVSTASFKKENQLNYFRKGID